MDLEGPSQGQAQEQEQNGEAGKIRTRTWAPFSSQPLCTVRLRLRFRLRQDTQCSGSACVASQPKPISLSTSLNLPSGSAFFGWGGQHGCFFYRDTLLLVAPGPSSLIANHVAQLRRQHYRVLLLLFSLSPTSTIIHPRHVCLRPGGPDTTQHPRSASPEAGVCRFPAI